MRSSSKILIAALAAATPLAGALHADLAKASPFLPPNSPLGAGGAGGPSGPVELRGMMPTDQGIECLIYDTAKKTSVWVGLNEPGYEFVVKSVNAASDTATVFYQGRSMQLEMRAAKVASAGTAQAGTPGNPVVAPGAAGLPSAADEQKRLDAVAAEVRRRRLEREKAFQAPGSTPPPVPPAR